MKPLCKKRLNEQPAQTPFACAFIGLAQPIRNSFGLFAHGLIGLSFVGQCVAYAQCA
jgi:hypothetical protein